MASSANDGRAWPTYWDGRRHRSEAHPNSNQQNQRAENYRKHNGYGGVSAGGLPEIITDRRFHVRFCSVLVDD